MNLFNTNHTPYRLPKRPRLFESFAGVGMQRMAFERLGIEYEMVGISEIDKYAIQSYMAIHGPTENYGDITKIKGEDLPQIDIFTYSFPCQDLSVAGKGRGMQEGTRSGLIFEVLRILRELKEINRLPGLLIMENVTALLNKKHIEGFEQIKQELAEIGYTNHLDKLNAKNYGVAQNRDRAFMVSTLGDHSYEFPKPIPLEKRLKDYLEDEVAEQYYLNENTLNFYIENSKKMEEKGNGFRFKPTDGSAPAFAITTRAGGRMDDNYIKVKEATKQGYAIATEGDSINLEQPSSKTRRGRVGVGMANTLTTSCNQGVVEPIIVDSSFKNSRAPRFYTETCPTINTMGGGNREPKVIEPTNNLRIRKLTPLECWRLMGIDDDDFHKAQASGVSNTQLYKQAGNGLVVDVFAALIGTTIGEIENQEEEKEVTMTVKELIEALSWCDEDKLVKVAKGDKRRDIISTDEDDENVVLIAS